MHNTSFIIDEKILIEAPPCINTLLLRRDCDITKLKAIVVSHLHGDHFLGLPMLLLEYLIRPRETPLNIYCRNELKCLIINLLKISYSDLDPLRVLNSSKAEFHEISNETDFKIDDYTFRPIRALHGEIDTFGFIITDLNCNKIFFSSDTQYYPGLQDILSDVDVAILDATTKDTSIPGHMSYNMLVDFGNKSNTPYIFAIHRTKYEVLVSHPKVICPKDGEEYEIVEKCPPKCI